MTAIPIAQALFLSSLRQQLPIQAPELDPEAVIRAGATNLQALAGSSASILLALQRCYATALSRTYILVLAAACAATVCGCGFEWKNIRTEAERRKALETDAAAQNSETKVAPGSMETMV